MSRIRWVIGFVVFGLVVSGLTAFPLRMELEILAGWVTDESGTAPRWPALSGLTEWILRVREGLVRTGEDYPFIAYGTDWLAFGHLVIAVFFVLPWREPVRYSGVLWVGVAASIGVIPTALICGGIREIPLGWRLIDCSFGLVCLVPLCWAIREIRRLAGNPGWREMP